MKAIQKMGPIGTWICKLLAPVMAIYPAITLPAIAENVIDTIYADHDASLISSDAIFHVDNDGKVHFFAVQQGQFFIQSDLGKNLLPITGIHHKEKPYALFQHQVDRTWHIVTLINNPAVDAASPDKLTLPNGNQIDALRTPDWGTNQIYQLYKVSPTGKAQLLETRASKGEAGDTPGHAILSGIWKEHGNSHIRLHESQHCTASSNVFTGRACHAGGLGNSEEQAFRQSIEADCSFETGQACQPELVAAIDCPTCRYRLWHGVAEGDSLKPISPVRLEDKNAGEFMTIPQLIQPDRSGEQIELASFNHLAVVRTQSNMTLALNLNTGQPTRITPIKTPLYWVPASRK